MRVRMNVSIAGLSFSYSPRQIVDLSDELAAQWIACGHASSLEEAPAAAVPATSQPAEEQQAAAPPASKPASPRKPKR